MFLPQDAFLRRLPRIMALEDRLSIQTIVSSLDIIEYCSQEIAPMLSGLIKSKHQLDDHDITKLLVNTWSIIDSFNNIRISIALKSKKKSGNRVKIELTGTDEIIRRLRNCYDHIATNLNNRAASRQPGYPLRGVLVASAGLVLEQQARHAIISLDKIHEVQLDFPWIDREKRVPVWPNINLDFFAFDMQVNINQLILDAEAWIERENARIENEFTQTLRSNNNNEEDIAIFLADHVSGNLTFFLTMG